MAGRLAGQTINDRLLAAKHSIAGQGLAKSVCKATTEEMIGPKKKHLDYLVQCTNEPNVSIPQLANLLIERSQNTNWVVVYKALITVHHMMCYGNERFTQYLASSNSSFQLSNFLDKSGVQGMLSARTGYDMSPFIRRYSRYLNEKAMSYRTVAFDFCKKRGNNEDGMLRTMHTDKLLKTLPVLQNQLDALLEFDCSANDLTNGVINNCFMLLFRDLIRLFACYNNGIINLLEKFFDMNKKQCREALDIYKKFLVRMDKVGEFLKVAENIGIDKGDIPDLTKAPSSLLEALEQHLAAIEGKKSSTSSTPSQTATNQKNVRSAVSALSSTSSSFGTVVANGRIDSHANGIDENLKIQVLAEEEAAMNQFKNKVQSPSNTANNPFFTSNGNHSMNASSTLTQSVDLFAAESLSTSQIKPSDDLLQLNNPFADVFSQPGQNVAAAPTPMNAFQLPAIQQPNNVNAWIANGNGYSTSHQMPMTNAQNGTFVSESSFQSVFGNNEIKTADGTLPQTQPSSSSFNPFLVDDPVPSLLIIDSPTHSTCPQPIQDVLNYFQKDVVDRDAVKNTHVESIYQKDVELLKKSDIDVLIVKRNETERIGTSNFQNVHNNEKSSNNFQEFHKGSGLSEVAAPHEFFPNYDAGQKIDAYKVNQIDSIIDQSNAIKISSQNNAMKVSAYEVNKKSDINLFPTTGDCNQKRCEIKDSTMKITASQDCVTNLTEIRGVDFIVIDDKIKVEKLTEDKIPDNNEQVEKSDYTDRRSVPPPRPPPPSRRPSNFDNNEPPVTCDSLTNPSLNNSFLTATEDLPLSQTIGSGFDALGGVLQPMSSGQGGGHNNNNHHHQNSGNNQQPGSALLTGDLESSLASLAENLSINSRPPPVKEIQWNSPKNGSKVNNSWTPQPMSATTGAGYKPMNQSMTTTTAQPPLIVQPQMFPTVMQPVMGMRPLAGNTMLPPQRPNITSAIPPAAANQMGPQQSLLFH